MKNALLISAALIFTVVIISRFLEQVDKAEVYVSSETPAYNYDGSHRPLTVVDVMAVKSPEGKWLPPKEWKPVLNSGNYEMTIVSPFWLLPEGSRPYSVSKVLTDPATE